MKKVLLAAAALAVLPVAGQAQTLQYPGFYIGVMGGANWLLNTNVTLGGVSTSASPNTGFLAGGMLGYDFVGPRVELEGSYRENTNTLNVNAFGVGSVGFRHSEVAVMANLYYDFNAGGVIVPYIGAGVGVGFTNATAGAGQSNSTNFAYQGMAGLGWNIDPMFRLNLEGRYHGTSNPTVNSAIGGGTYQNNNISALLALHIRFGAPAAPVAAPTPAPAAPPSFMVFFDWDRSNLSAQALNTIKQAANAFKAKGQARVTATGHADRSGPDQYNMALSLRRANAVKNALVREGVPATAIAVVGRGESMPLVQTADGVREPQNRRVEIVVQ
jgi:outer membrane protein OmpA-like peptidoglycan-associated protein